MKLLICLVVSLCLLILVVGCAGGPRPRAAVEVSPTVQKEILSSLKVRNEALESLRGFASVRVGRGIFGTRGETAFAIRKPDHVRIDGLSDFGLYASQLSLQGSQLTVVWPNDHLYYQGEASQEALQRFLLVGLPAEEVGQILMTLVPLSLDRDFAIQPQKNYFLLKSDQGEMEVMEVKDRHGLYLPRKVIVLDDQGDHRYEVTYEDFQEHSKGVWIPDRLKIRFWNPKVKMELRFKDLEVNPKLNDKVFKIAIPDDAEPIDAP